MLEGAKKGEKDTERGRWKGQGSQEKRFCAVGRDGAGEMMRNAAGLSNAAACSGDRGPRYKVGPKAGAARPRRGQLAV